MLPFTNNTFTMLIFTMYDVTVYDVTVLPQKDDSFFFILQSKTLFYIFMRAVGSCNVFKIER